MVLSYLPFKLGILSSTPDVVHEPGECGAASRHDACVLAHGARATPCWNVIVSNCVHEITKLIGYVPFPSSPESSLTRLERTAVRRSRKLPPQIKDDVWTVAKPRLKWQLLLLEGDRSHSSDEKSGLANSCCWLCH